MSVFYFCSDTTPEGCVTKIKIQFSMLIWFIPYVCEALISSNTPVFVMELKKQKQKRIQSQLLSIVSCCCCSNSDNPGCRFPETPRHNWVYCGRDPPICYTPPHLSIFFIIVVVLFFLCCSSFPRFLVSKWKKLIRFRMLSQVVFDLLRPSSPFIRVRVGIYFFGFWVCLFFFLLLLLMLLVLFCYFFFPFKFSDAHTIHLFIHW